MQRTSQLMETTAHAFLAALTADQRARAQIAFDDEERFNWAFFPMQRRGIALNDLQPEQRQLGHALISSGYSPEGAAKALMIMSLDEILFRKEQDEGRAQQMIDTVPLQVQRFLLVSGMERLWRTARDPESYYITIFGEPSSSRTWGWRLEGHHVSLNATLVDGTELVTAPSFFGANPAEIRQGPRAGLRVLSAEEDLARQFLAGLEEGQRARAVIAAEAPADILTYNHRQADPLDQDGLPADALTPAQRERLMALLETYAAALPAETAAARMAQVTAAPPAELRFAWAGGTAPGEKHYYRVQSPTFLLEYDNTQDGGNHIHTVWRQFNGDWGLDLLGQHLRAAHAV
jgi:hypothetical protein